MVFRPMSKEPKSVNSSIQMRRIYADSWMGAKYCKYAHKNGCSRHTSKYLDPSITKKLVISPTTVNTDTKLVIVRARVQGCTLHCTEQTCSVPRGTDLGMPRNLGTSPSTVNTDTKVGTVHGWVPCTYLYRTQWSPVRTGTVPGHGLQGPCISMYRQWWPQF